VGLLSHTLLEQENEIKDKLWHISSLDKKIRPFIHCHTFSSCRMLWAT